MAIVRFDVLAFELRMAAAAASARDRKAAMKRAADFLRTDDLRRLSTDQRDALVALLDPDVVPIPKGKRGRKPVDEQLKLDVWVRVIWWEALIRYGQQGPPALANLPRPQRDIATRPLAKGEGAFQRACDCVRGELAPHKTARTIERWFYTVNNNAMLARWREDAEVATCGLWCPDEHRRWEEYMLSEDQRNAIALEQAERELPEG